MPVWRRTGAGGGGGRSIGRPAFNWAQRRAAAQPFTPWKGELRGEEVLWRDGVLSLRLTGWESRGDGKVNRVQWGDVWKVREGAPCPPEEWLGKRRGRKKRLADQIIAQGEQRQSAGGLGPRRGLAGKSAKKPPLAGRLSHRGGDRAGLPPGRHSPHGGGKPHVCGEGLGQQKTPPNGAVT